MTLETRNCRMPGYEVPFGIVPSYEAHTKRKKLVKYRQEDSIKRCLPFCIVLLASLLSVTVHAQGRTNAEANGKRRPKIVNLSPSSGPVGTAVTITGTNFGTAGTVTFNRTAATPTSWSANRIVAPVPEGATTGNVVVTVGGVGSNGVSFAVTSSTNVVTTPTFNPGSGTYGSAQTVTISS